MSKRKDYLTPEETAALMDKVPTDFERWLYEEMEAVDPAGDRYEPGAEWSVYLTRVLMRVYEASK